MSDCHGNSIMVSYLSRLSSSSSSPSTASSSSARWPNGSEEIEVVLVRITRLSLLEDSTNWSWKWLNLILQILQNRQQFSLKSCYYHPRMQVGNVFGHICVSVQAITFERLLIGTLCMVWGYILTMSRSRSSIKVIESTYFDRSLIRSRSQVKVILRVKSTPRSNQGHL